MVGLVAASWRADRAERANRLFEQVLRGWRPLEAPAQPCEAAGPAFRAAGFAKPHSPWPQIGRSPDGRWFAVVAGWWFDPMDERSRQPALDELACRCWNPREQVLQRLQGQYALVTGDIHSGELQAGGDLTGLFPLYLAQEDGIAWVSTSSAALAAALRPRLDRMRVAALFLKDVARAPRSAFEGIRRLGIGERVRLRDGKACVERVWTPFVETRAVRFGDAVEEGLQLLDESCVRLRQAWPRLVSDLTSGLDSRLTAAVMARGGDPLSVTVNGPTGHVDVEIARQCAQAFGWSFHHFPPPDDWARTRWPFFQRGMGLAEGEMIGSLIDGTIRVKEQLGRMFDAATGGGGGEIYRDFFWAQEYLKIGRSSALDIRRLLRYRFFSRPRLDLGLFSSQWYEEYEADQVRTIQALLEPAAGALNTLKLDAIYLWKNSGHIGRYAGSVFNILAAPQPLFTRALYSYTAGVPWRYRLRSRLMRHLITRAHPALAAIPTWYGGSARPLSALRPGECLVYAGGRLRRLINKLAQLGFGKTVFRSVGELRFDPRHDREFIPVLAAAGLLDMDNLRSASLYRADGLRRFLERARQPGFGSFVQLYAVVSIELLCRACDLDPPEPL